MHQHPDTRTEPCPACGQLVHDDADRCPECGQTSAFVDRYRRQRMRAFGSRVSAWPARLAVALALAATLCAVLVRVQRTLSPPAPLPPLRPGMSVALPPPHPLLSTVGTLLLLAVLFAGVAILLHRSAWSWIALSVILVAWLLIVALR